jgi:hypothetical protein
MDITGEKMLKILVVSGLDYIPGPSQKGGRNSHVMLHDIVQG